MAKKDFNHDNNFVYLSDVSEEKKESLSADNSFFAEIFSEKYEDLLSKIEISSDDKGVHVRYHDGDNKSFFRNAETSSADSFRTVDNYYKNDAPIERIPNFTLGQDSPDVSLSQKVSIDDKGHVSLKPETSEKGVSVFCNISPDGNIRDIATIDNRGDDRYSVKVLIPKEISTESADAQQKYLEGAKAEISNLVLDIKPDNSIGDSPVSIDTIKEVFVSGDYHRISCDASIERSNGNESSDNQNFRLTVETDVRTKTIETSDGSTETKSETFKMTISTDGVEYRFREDACSKDLGVSTASEFKDVKDSVIDRAFDRIDGIKENFIDKGIEIKSFFDSEKTLSISTKNIDIGEKNSTIREGKVEFSLNVDGEVTRLIERDGDGRNITVYFNDTAFSPDALREAYESIDSKIEALSDSSDNAVKEDIDLKSVKIDGDFASITIELTKENPTDGETSIDNIKETDSLNDTELTTPENDNSEESTSKSEIKLEFNGDKLTTIAERIDNTEYRFSADSLKDKPETISDFKDSRDSILSEMKETIDGIKDALQDSDKGLSIGSFFDKEMTFDNMSAGRVTIFEDGNAKFTNITEDNRLTITSDSEGHITSFKETDGTGEKSFEVKLYNFVEALEQAGVEYSKADIVTYIEGMHEVVDDFASKNGFSDNDIKNVYVNGDFLRIEVSEHILEKDLNISNDVSDSETDTDKKDPINSSSETSDNSDSYTRDVSFSFKTSELISIDIKNGDFSVAFSGKDCSLDYYFEHKESLFKSADSKMTSLLGDNYGDLNGHAVIKDYSIHCEFKSSIDASDLKDRNGEFFSEKIEDGEKIKSIDVRLHDSDIRHDTCAITLEDKNEHMYVREYDIATGHLDREFGYVSDNNDILYRVEVIHVDIDGIDGDRAFVKIHEIDGTTNGIERTYTGSIDSAFRTDINTDSSVTSFIYQQIADGKIEDLEGLKCKEHNKDTENDTHDTDKPAHHSKEDTFLEITERLSHVDTREYYASYVLNADKFDAAIEATENRISEIKTEICEAYESDKFDPDKIKSLNLELRFEEDKLKVEKGSSDFNSGRSEYRGLDYLKELKENKAEISRLNTELKKEESKPNPDSEKIASLKESISRVEARTDSSVKTYYHSTSNLVNELICKAVLPRIENPFAREILKTLSLEKNDVRAFAKIATLIDARNEYEASVGKIDKDISPEKMEAIMAKAEEHDRNPDMHSMYSRMPEVYREVFKAYAELNPFKLLVDFLRGEFSNDGKEKEEKESDKEKEGAKTERLSTESKNDGEQAAKSATEVTKDPANPTEATQIKEKDETTDTERFEIKEKSPDSQSVDAKSTFESKLDDLSDKMEKILEKALDSDKLSSLMDKIEGLIEKFFSPDAEHSNDKEHNTETKGDQNNDKEKNQDNKQQTEVKGDQNNDKEKNQDNKQQTEVKGDQNNDKEKNQDNKQQTEVKPEETEGDKSKLETFFEKFDQLVSDALDKHPDGNEIKEKLSELLDKFIDTLDRELSDKTEKHGEDDEEKEKDKDSEEHNDENDTSVVEETEGEDVNHLMVDENDPTLNTEEQQDAPPEEIDDEETSQTVEEEDDDDDENNQNPEKDAKSNETEEAAKNVEEKIKSKTKEEDETKDDQTQVTEDMTGNSGDNSITDDSTKGSIEERLSDLFDSILENGNFKELFEVLSGDEMGDIVSEFIDVLNEIDLGVVLDALKEAFTETFFDGNDQNDKKENDSDTEEVEEVTELASNATEGDVKPPEAETKQNENSNDNNRQKEPEETKKMPEEVKQIEREDLDDDDQEDQDQYDDFDDDTDGDDVDTDGSDGSDGADGADGGEAADVGAVAPPPPP